MRQKNDDTQDPRFYSGLGRAIEVLRVDRGLSRKELAEDSGLSYPYVSEIETGRKRPSSRALLAIARALGVRPHELVAAAEERSERETPSGSRFFHQASAPVAAASPPPRDLAYKSVPLSPRVPPFEEDRYPVSEVAIKELVATLRRLDPGDFATVAALVRRLADESPRDPSSWR